MFQPPIDENGEFEIDGIRFHIDLTPGNKRRPSDAHAFTLVKSRSFLDRYAAIAEDLRPGSLLELGIFQGGSYVLFDKMFRPDRMSAVDISPRPVQPLVEYVESLVHRHVHFATPQDDEAALCQIVDQELAGSVDMVVDDASHLYEQSKRSFEILFPRLSPGGLYIIEDWSWSHNGRNQAPDAPLANHAALTSLAFELVALLGSTHDVISEITICRPFVMIKKGNRNIPEYWSKLALRGKPLPKI